MADQYDLIVVGGGIIGLSVAYKFQIKYPSKRILVLEKEMETGKHQTGRNSGVIHSGIYYKPGSLKATLCRQGKDQLIAFAQANQVAYELCGKLIVATNEAEIPLLENIYLRGMENGLTHIKKITAGEIKNYEPEISGVAAIHVPDTGIIDYKGVLLALIKGIQSINPSSDIHFNSEVSRIESVADQKRITTTSGKQYEGVKLIVCGGLEADRLAKLDQVDCGAKIVPFRGDYYQLTSSAQHKVKNLVYPVPNPQFPFLGVHFTRMTNGGVECGPNAVFSFKRDGYSKWAFSWRDTIDALGYSGTLKLFKKHWKYGLGEYQRAFSKAKFHRALCVLMPGLKLEELEPARCGIRAQALDAQGNLIDDFHIVSGVKSLHVINAPSPAATASLAIADYLIEQLELISG